MANEFWNPFVLQFSVCALTAHLCEGKEKESKFPLRKVLFFSPHRPGEEEEF